MACETLKNPLVRDGISQRQRLLSSLLPGFVQVDERSLPDLVAYALQYAEELKYYNPANLEDGDWREFIEHDITTLLSVVARRNPRTDHDDFIAELELMRSDALNRTSDRLRELFMRIFTLAQEVDGWYARSLEGFKLHDDLHSGILQTLRPALVAIIGYENAAATLFGLGAYVPLPYHLLGEVWELDTSAVSADFLALDTLYNTGIGYTPPPIDAQIANLLDPLEERMEQLIRAFFHQISYLAHTAPLGIQQSLEAFPKHEMHYALFLAFLLLFQQLQEELNGYTQRHLDFYYKSVLHLKERPAVPDNVHLVFTLARNVSSHLLPKGMEFKAGKDALGKDVVFALAEDLVLGQTTVAALQTVFVNKFFLKVNSGGLCETQEKVIDVYHAPIANSKDGIGTPLEEPDPSWETVGEDQSLLADNARTMVGANLGFAIASPILVLNEGHRILTVTLTFDPTSFRNGFIHPMHTDLVGPLTGTFSEPSKLLEEAIAKSMRFRFSGAKEWVEPTNDESATGVHPTAKLRVTTSGQYAPEIQFVLIFRADKAAITYYNPSVLGAVSGNDAPFPTEWPIGLFEIDPDNQLGMYEYFRHLRLKSAKLDVKVTSVTNLMIQNDAGPVDVSKPFLPFGTQPVAGSGFYIGNAEVFSKHLTSLDVNIQWLDPPADMTTHYQPYAVPEIPNTAPWQNRNKCFTANLLVLQDHFWTEINFLTPYPTAPDGDPVYGSSYAHEASPPPVRPHLHAEAAPYYLASDMIATYEASMGVVFDPGHHEHTPNTPNTPTPPPPLGSVKGVFLFHQLVQNATGGTTKDARSEKIIVVPGGAFSGINYGRDPEIRSIARYQPNMKRGYMKLELNAPDFQHKEYAKVLTKELVRAMNAKEDPKLPGDPYTPTIKTISVNYTSEITVDFETAASPNFFLRNKVEQFFHLEPAGFAPIQPVAQPLLTASTSYTLPSLTVVTDALVPQLRIPRQNLPLLEGALHIGLQGLVPPQTISILFQVAEGTGNVDYNIPTVTWSYLRGNRWIPFRDEEIVADTTLGLLQSGIIRYSIPRDASNDNTVMPIGLHWLRAEVQADSPALPRMLSVHAQAGLATFVDRSNDPERLRTPLPEETIAKAVTKDYAVKEVIQPYVSFGGRIQEEQADFYRNVSERLRHKGFAINIWDYEHLILDRFPEVYRCKCLNHTNRYAEVAPGKVTVILIPNLASAKGVNPLEPRVSVSTLAGVRQFLERIISPFIELDVRNPRYEQITLDFKLKLRDGYDYQFYTTRLQKEIIEFLTPWAYDQSRDIAFGGKVYRSVLINFVEERPYVDFVTDFRMLHTVEGIQSADLTEISTRSNLSILVSAPEHTIHPVTNCP